MLVLSAVEGLSANSFLALVIEVFFLERITSGHPLHAPPPLASFNAMKSAKSSSQEAFSAQKESNALRKYSGEDWKRENAFCKRSSFFGMSKPKFILKRAEGSRATDRSLIPSKSS